MARLLLKFSDSGLSVNSDRCLRTTAGLEDSFVICTLGGRDDLGVLGGCGLGLRSSLNSGRSFSVLLLSFPAILSLFPDEKKNRRLVRGVIVSSLLEFRKGAWSNCFNEVISASLHGERGIDAVSLSS